MSAHTKSKCCNADTYRDKIDGGTYCTICDHKQVVITIQAPIAPGNPR